MLSYAEFMHYYPDEQSGKASPTDYAMTGGSSSNTNNKKVIDNIDNIKWWLRSPHNTELGWADAVEVYTKYDHILTDAPKGNYNGVRPVMWVDVTADYFAP